MAVPRGAKNPQLAFDFVRYTVWEHGERLGPTTNGYVSQKLAEPWSSYLIKHQAKLRAKNKYPGNPMAEAAPIVAKDAALAGTSYPKNPNTAYFNTQMANAWSQVAFGKKTPAEALGDVQKLIDAKNQQR
jgi:maltose-binding protein MalE